jgi:methyl-accepting chemotaxis protein
VRENIDGTQSMTAEIQDSAERIQHLADEVRNIGKVLDVIRAVSEQNQPAGPQRSDRSCPRR